MNAGATFGIDLASQEKRTASCLIEWDHNGRGIMRCPEAGGSDPQLLERMTDRRDVAHVAIDAPFGWPGDFIDAITSYRNTGVWPVDDSSSLHLRLRATDRMVHEVTGLWPLSVSTDRIGIVAMRCARLLSACHQELGEPLDRSGQGRLLEVYPAAALQRWGLSPRHSAEDPGSYKGSSSASRARRVRLVSALVERTTPWLEISEKSQAACVDSDDCLDAAISALVARAARRGLLVPLADADVESARVEGWIRLPLRDSLTCLGPG